MPQLSDDDVFYDDKSRPETLKQLNRMQQDPFFDSYRRHPIWKALSAALLGEEATLTGPSGSTNPPALAMSHHRIRITFTSACGRRRC